MAAILAVPLALAQPAFDFMPRGGATLLGAVLDGCGECPPVAELAQQERDAEGWANYFQERAALDALSEAERATLTAYLATNLPAEGAESVEDLPRSGRDIAVVQCTVCHSIALPMTTDRTVDRWREHAELPPHDAIGLSDTEWRTLAAYLAHNAPLPLERIPQELRQGAGGY